MKRTQETKMMGVAMGLAVCVAVATAVAQSTASADGDTTVNVAGQGGGCSPTAAAAVEALTRKAVAAHTPAVQGFRVKTVRWDPLQRQSWAVVERCEHPELPTVAVLTKLPGPFAVAGGTIAAGQPVLVGGDTVSAAVIRANTAVAVVKAGDVVRLWKADERAHIELIGTAEENGVVGARVRVRLATPKEADGQTAPPQFLAGVVRGPADVEIER